MSTTLKYNCPNCNGTLSFHIESQLMICSYCDGEFDAKSILDFQKNLGELREDTQTDSSDAWGKDELEHLITHICQSCNGEIITEKTAVVSACPYCDNNVFLPKQFQDELRPDYIIPFRLNKEQAKACLHDYYKKKPLLNACFKQKNKLDEIKGIYVPFWLFRCDTAVELYYKGSRQYKNQYSEDGKTEIQHFMIKRTGFLDFENIPADASSKMNDIYMEAIEPYDFGELEEFNPGFLAGYMADKYDVSIVEMEKRVHSRIRTTLIQAFEPKGYSAIAVERSNIRFQKKEVYYALLPVWVLHTDYKGKLYTFMMNGQTGKMVGELPVDKLRCLGLFFAVFLGLSLSISSLIWLLF